MEIKLVGTEVNFARILNFQINYTIKLFRHGYLRLIRAEHMEIIVQNQEREFFVGGKSTTSNFRQFSFVGNKEGL